MHGNISHQNYVISSFHLPVMLNSTLYGAICIELFIQEGVLNTLSALSVITKITLIIHHVITTDPMKIKPCILQKEMKQK